MRNMFVIPWRVKNAISNNFPLLYHYVANFGVAGNSPEHWDHHLELSWDDDSRNWPTKDGIIKDVTDINESIVDLGCGNGSILRYLKKAGYTSLHGFEISQYAINRLSEDGIHMQHGVLPELPYEDDQFDFVIASQVLEHIIKRKKFISEIRRVLKKNGRAAIFVPDDCLGPIDEHEHVIKYNKNSLQKFLSKYFTIQLLESVVDENHPMPVLYALVKK